MDHSGRSLFARPWMVCILALICTFLWGSAFPCVKAGYHLFGISGDDTGSQILFAGYRFTLAGVITGFISSLGTKKIAFPKKEILGNVLVLGLLQTTIQYVFFYIGMAHTTGVKGSILSAASSFFTIALAHFLVRGERMNARKGIGCTLGFIGVIIVNFSSDGMAGGFSLNGEGLMLISSLAYAASSIYVKGFAAKDNSFTITAYQLFAGGAALIVTGILMGGSLQGFTVKSTLLLIYMAVISSVAFSVWTILLKYNPVGQVAIYGFTTPVFGMLLSSLFLGENAFNLKNIAALLCVSLGILIVNIRVNRKHKDRENCV